MILLNAENITKTYSVNAVNDTKVLSNVTIRIDSGESVAIVGPSGAGKSTLLHILGTLDIPDSGKITAFFDSQSLNYASLSPTKLSHLRNNHIGFVFQFHHLLPEFTALENVSLPARIAGTSATLANQKANELLKAVGMSNRAHHKSTELSGGEQQRIAIARALINNPSILFADEPTGNLDSANTYAILQLLQKIHHEQNITLVIATHSVDVAKSMKRLITMRDGTIIRDEQQQPTVYR